MTLSIVYIQKNTIYFLFLILFFTAHTNDCENYINKTRNSKNLCCLISFMCFCMLKLAGSALWPSFNSWCIKMFYLDTRFSAPVVNPLNPELNPICYLLALLGAHHFLHVSRIRVKSLAFRRLMSYIYGAPIPDVSRSHTSTQHSR